MQTFTEFLIGISIGLSSGLFGIGGALIATPMLKLFVGLPPLLALASPLPAAIPSAISGSVAYYRQKLVDIRAARLILITAVPLNIAASYAAHYIHSDWLMIATAGLMLYAGGSFTIRSWLLREEQRTQSYTNLIMYSIGIATGLLSGLLAVGGGIVMVPALVRLAGFTLKQALATSLLCVAALSIPGTIVHGAHGHIDWGTALILALTSIPFSYLGARLALRIRSKTLERVYGIFMICFAIYFVVRY